MATIALLRIGLRLQRVDGKEITAMAFGYVIAAEVVL
jgi:hypothetical protein